MSIINIITRERVTFCLLFVISILLSSCNSSSSKAYIPESNGNINTLTVVMEKEYWSSELGDQVRAVFGGPYEGLPFDEPKYDVYYICLL